MPTTYTLADDDTLTLVAKVMKRHHPRLAEAAVKVGVLMAANAEGPAIKHGGYPVLACIKVVGLKDRVLNGCDAVMLIDQHDWDDFREEQKVACIDHELSHIDTIDLPPDQLKAARQDDPKAPSWKLDDLGRPKLKSVPGDWNAGDGFSDVVARHGQYAIEYVNLTRAKGRADAARSAGERGEGR